jgi:hypothetical protein
MILPQTDHAMILIAAASLLLPKPKMPLLPATTQDRAVGRRRGRPVGL